MITTLEKFFDQFRTYDLSRISHPEEKFVGCFDNTCEKQLLFEDAMTLNVNGTVLIGCRAHIRAELVEVNMQAEDMRPLEAFPLILALQLAIKQQRCIDVCRDLLRDRRDAYTLEQLKQRCAGKTIPQQSNHLHAGNVDQKWAADYEARIPLAQKALEAWDDLRKDFQKAFPGLPWKNDRWETVSDEEFERLPHWSSYVDTATALWKECGFSLYDIQRRIRERRGPFLPPHPFFTVRVFAGSEIFKYFLVDKMHGDVLTDMLYRDNKKHREETGRTPENEEDFKAKVMATLDSTLHRT